MNKETNGYPLSDEVIGHVAKTLQIALITGTDIVDNLRLLRLVEHEGQLVLSPDCAENFEQNLNNLLEEVPKENSPFSGATTKV
jgi:hypothetical protein